MLRNAAQRNDPTGAAFYNPSPEPVGRSLGLNVLVENKVRLPSHAVVAHITAPPVNHDPPRRSESVAIRTGSGPRGPTRETAATRDTPHEEVCKVIGMMGAEAVPTLFTRPGSGIGLYLARGLTEAMGGRVAYEPGPGGRGSTFRVHLRRASGSRPPG